MIDEKLIDSLADLVYRLRQQIETAKEDERKIFSGLNAQSKVIDTLRRQNEALKAACELTLLFHSASPWTAEKQIHWGILLDMLLGPAAERKELPENTAITRNLCNGVRAALELAQREI